MTMRTGTKTLGARHDSSFDFGNSVYVKDDTLGHPTNYKWSNSCVLAGLSFLRLSELWILWFRKLEQHAFLREGL